MRALISRLFQIAMLATSPARQRRRLLLGWLVLTLIATAITVWSIHEDRVDLENRSSAELNALSRALAEHADHLLAQASSSLVAVKSSPDVQAALQQDDSKLLRNALQQAVLRHRVFENLQVLPLDGHGVVGTDSANSQPYVEPAALASLLHDARRDRFLFGPTRDAIGNSSPLIPVILPLDNPQAEGGRVLIGQLPVRQFSAFYDSLSLPRGSVVTIYEESGRLLVRYPDTLIPSAMTREQLVNISLSYARAGEAPFWIVSPFDGQRRLISIRTMPSLPLVLAVGKPDHAVFDGWAEESAIKGLMCFLLVASVGVAFLRVYFQLLHIDQQRVSIKLARLTLDQSADMVLVLDQLGQVLYRNALAQSQLGLIEHWRQLDTPAETLAWPALWAMLMDQKGRTYFTTSVRSKGGERLPARIAAAHLEIDEAQYVSLVLHDVSAQQEGEERIRQREEQLRIALAASDSGLYDVHLDTGEIVLDEHLQMLLSQGQRLPGVRPQDVWLQTVHPDDRSRAAQVFQAYLEGQSPVYINEFRQMMASGEYRWMLARGRFVEYDDMGRPQRIMGTLTDIHDRKLAEARIHELSNYDPLTGLSNRNAVRLRLLDALSQTDTDNQVALLFVNVDRFKTINDSLGHQLGDQILLEVANRLRQFAGPHRLLARLGGDEFGLIQLASAQSQSCEQLAEQILRAISQPLQLAGHEISLSASIGISYAPEDARTVEDVLRHADSAMHHAKDCGRNRWCSYQQEMGARASEQLMLETALRRALERNELELHYQPQFRIQDGALVGFEALLRWRHAELGMVSPARFIPVAEASGLIVPLGEWVLREACRQNKAWQSAGLLSIVVAVNLSAPQFKQDDLLIRVREALVMSDLDPQWLELEVTESVVMNNVSRVIETLDALKEMGLQLAIDDFGTGYSSLAYLKQFAVDKLKIDRAFVNDLASNPNDAAIIEAIVALGQTMGMLVIAEGVETPEQLARLREVGCNEVQGFYTGKPMPAAEVPAILARGRWPQD